MLRARKKPGDLERADYLEYLHGLAVSHRKDAVTPEERRRRAAQRAQESRDRRKADRGIEDPKPLTAEQARAKEEERKRKAAERQKKYRERKNSASRG
jgi:hypothetical protein